MHVTSPEEVDVVTGGGEGDGVGVVVVGSAVVVVVGADGGVV